MACLSSGWSEGAFQSWGNAFSNGGVSVMDSCEPIRCIDPGEQGGPCWYGCFPGSSCLCRYDGSTQGQTCGNADGMYAGPLGAPNPPFACEVCAACALAHIAVQLSGWCTCSGSCVVPHLLSVHENDVAKGSLENVCGQQKWVSCPSPHETLAVPLEALLVAVPVKQSSG